MEKQQIIKKLKGLKQYSDLNDQELEKIAEKILDNKFIESLVFVTDKDEEKLAKQLIDKYTEEWEFNSYSDKSTLVQLVDLELLNYKIKKKIAEIERQSKTETSSGILQKDLLEQLIRNTEEIIKLKSTLGMTKAEREKNQSDLVAVLETLKRRFKDWINLPENKSNYTLICPHCQQYVLIRRRLDKEKDEVLNHPFFIEGGITFNKYLFKMYKEGKISKYDVSQILDVSEDYIDWVIKKYGNEL